MAGEYKIYNYVHEMELGSQPSQQFNIKCTLQEQVCHIHKLL